MKDLVGSSLDINIYVEMSKMAEKRLFDCTIEAIEYYELVQSLTRIKFIFFQLTRLSPLIEPLIDLNRTKSQSYSENIGVSNEVDIGNGMDISNEINNKIPWIDRLPPTNPNKTESESCNNHCNIYNTMSKEIPLMKEI